MNSTHTGIGRYRRTKSVGLVPAFTGGASYETLHRQQREREAAGLPKVKPCLLCRGLAMHYAGCPETWDEAGRTTESAAMGARAAAAYAGDRRGLGQNLDAAA